MLARVPVPIRIGVLVPLLGAAWFGAWNWWYATRIYVPLDVSISLSPSHIQTADFAINIQSKYSILIDIHSRSDDLACLLGARHCENGHSVLRLSWSLSKRGKVIATGSSDGHSDPYYWGTADVGREVGSFDLGSGRYQLDLNILDDASVLNDQSPHLIVFDNGYAGVRADELRFRAFLLFLFSIAAGLFTLVRWALHGRLDKHAALDRAYPLTERGPMAPLNRKKPSLAAKSPRLSFFSLILTITLALMCLVFLLLHALDEVPRGLPIRLLRPGVTTVRATGIQPLRIQIKSVPYMDSRFIPWKEFRSVLEKEISRRPPDWPVYLEADRNIEWESVAKAIDIIRGLHTEVVLLTSGTKSTQRVRQ